MFGCGRFGDVNRFFQRALQVNCALLNHLTDVFDPVLLVFNTWGLCVSDRKREKEEESCGKPFTNSCVNCNLRVNCRCWAILTIAPCLHPWLSLIWNIEENFTTFDIHNTNWQNWLWRQMDNTDRCFFFYSSSDHALNDLTVLRTVTKYWCNWDSSHKLRDGKICCTDVFWCSWPLDMWKVISHHRLYSVYID